MKKQIIFKKTEDGVRAINLIGKPLIGKIKFSKGVASIDNHSTGFGHSAHPNIDKSGSIAGYKKRGFWAKDDKIVTVHGYHYNVSRVSVSNELDELCLQIENGKVVRLPETVGETVKIILVEPKEKLGKDYKEKLTDEWFNDRAESHLDAWKDRYYRKSKKDMEFDLHVNHDPSLEIESAEEELGRELTSFEAEKLTLKFNKTVIKIYYK